MIALGQPPTQPGAVLLIKPSSLGDVVTALPVLHGLRRTFPRARITWLLSRTCAALLEGQDGLDEIMLFDRRRLGKAWFLPGAARDLVKFLTGLAAAKFDWVIDLQGLLRSGIFSAVTRAEVRAGFADAREGAPLFYTHSFRVAALHAVERNIELARRLGIDAQPSDMSLRVIPSARQFVQDLFLRHGLREKGYIVCAPSTRWTTKQYPPRHWRQVVGRLSQWMPVVLVGSPEDKALCAQVQGHASANNAEVMPKADSPWRAWHPTVNLAGLTSVPQMVAVIAASAGVICNDSAAKFIASAVGVPPLVLLGPTRTELTGPYLSGRAIVSPTPCQGCLKKRCRHITCMELIDPAEVVAMARDLFGTR